MALDFLHLGSLSPALQPFLRGCRGAPNFSNPAALRALCAALLRHHWGIEGWDCPSDRLCPTVPSRLNYLLWVQDLLAGELRGRGFFEGLLEDDAPSPPPPPLGVDVGTGASCILALLGASACGFRFIATEVDAASARSAAGNAARAGAAGASVRVVASAGGTAEALEGRALGCVEGLLRGAFARAAELAPAGGGGGAPGGGALEGSAPPAALRAGGGGGAAGARCDGAVAAAWGALSRALAPPRGAAGGVAFSLCNPPFFSSPEEAAASMARRLGSARTGAAVELSCAGGEAAFGAALAAESGALAACGDAGACWFTAWLSRGSSVAPLAARARAAGATAVRTAALRQGRTLRWVVAWTFAPAVAVCARGWAPHAPPLPGAPRPRSAPLFEGSPPSPPPPGWADEEEGGGGGASDGEGAAPAGGSGGATATAAAGAKRARGGGGSGGGGSAQGEEDVDEEEEGQLPPLPPRNGSDRGRAPPAPERGRLLLVLAVFDAGAGGCGGARLAPRPLPVGRSSFSLRPPLRDAVAAARIFAAGPPPGVAPLPLADARARLEEALATSDGGWACGDARGARPVLLFWSARAEVVADAVGALDGGADAVAAAAWRGALLLLRGSDGAEALFTFELQLLRAGALAAAALSCLSIAEGGGGGGGGAAAAAAPRACFNRFAEQLRGGLLRTGRKWRRRAAGGGP